MVSIKYMDNEYVKREFQDDIDRYAMVVISGNTDEVLAIANTLNESWSARRHDNTTDCYISLNNISDFMDVVIEINNFMNVGEMS